MSETLSWIDYPKLREIPSRQSPFSVSDVVDLLEIWCVSSIDKKISTSQLINFFDDDLAIVENEQDYGTDIPKRIRKEEFFTFVHQRLKYRRDKWGQKWPFSIITSQGNINIIYKPSYFSTTYLVFLFCSNLHIIKKTDSHFFTSAFENLAFKHFSSIHPYKNGWITKSMGANNSSVHSYIGSTQREKLEALARDLNCGLGQFYRSTSSGDGGIDLVSFLSWGDLRPSSSIAFGQCACTNSKRTILDKISETSWDSIRDKLDINSMPLNYLYSPLDLRSEVRPSGFELDGTRNAVIIDRTRFLLRNFDCSDTVNSKLKSYIYRFIQLEENYYEAI